jgi:hypothetical protein
MARMDEHARVVWRHLVPILNDEREHTTEDLPGPDAWAEADTTDRRRVWLSSDAIAAAMT